MKTFSRKNNYNIFIIKISLFISLLFLSALIAQKPAIVFFLFVLAISTLIAYSSPNCLIFLMILLGQIIQFELEEIFGIHTEKIDFSNFTIRFSDPLLFGVVVTIFLKLNNEKNQLTRLFKNNSIFFSFFLSILLLQIIRNIGLYGIHSFGEFRTYYQFLFFVPYLIISLKKIEDRRSTFLLLLILSLSHIFFGVFKGGVLFGLKFEAYNKWLSSFGSLALLYGMVALFLLKKTETIKINQVFCFLLYLTGISIIIISSSRAVWGAAFMGLFFLTCLGQFKLNNLFKIFLLSPILFYLLSLLFVHSSIDLIPFIEDRLTAFTNFKNDPTALWRHTFWLSSLAKIKENLFWGHGFGQHFQVYIPEFDETITTSPHNLYLTILFHSGLTGLTIYLICVFNVFIFLKKGSKRLFDEKYIILTGMVVLFSVHFYGVAYSFEKDFFSWMYIGTAISSVYNSTGEINVKK